MAKQKNESFVLNNDSTYSYSDGYTEAGIWKYWRRNGKMKKSIKYKVIHESDSREFDYVAETERIIFGIKFKRSKIIEQFELNHSDVSLTWVRVKSN